MLVMLWSIDFSKGERETEISISQSLFISIEYHTIHFIPLCDNFCDFFADAFRKFLLFSVLLIHVTLIYIDTVCLVFFFMNKFINTYFVIHFVFVFIIFFSYLYSFIIFYLFYFSLFSQFILFLIKLLGRYISRDLGCILELDGKRTKNI